MEDRIYIQRTLNGDPQAFRPLIIKYQKPIFKFLSTFIYEKALVEDLAQETFLRAYNALSTYHSNSGASFSTWLFTIARNLAFNELKKIKVRNNFSEASTQAETNFGEHPANNLDKVETNQFVRSAIENLPTDFKTSIVLFFLKEHTLSEIATIEGCSEGTIKSRIFRGKNLLKKYLLPILGEHYGKNM